MRLHGFYLDIIVSSALGSVVFEEGVRLILPASAICGLNVQELTSECYPNPASIPDLT